MNLRLRFAVTLLAFAAAPVIAQVTVTDAWVRGTVPGQKGTGAFMKLTSATDAILLSAASPVASVVEIHEMAHEGGMMRMRAIGELKLPAGKPVELRPGSYHVMMMDLKQPLKEGETVPVTLTFRDASGKKTSLEVAAPVRALTSPAMKH
jgi:periplasmic copper chaperone A